MSLPPTFSNSRFPISAFFDAVPVSPDLIDWLRVRIEGFDSLDFCDLVVEPVSGGVDFSAAFVTPLEFKIEPAGPEFIIGISQWSVDVSVKRDAKSFRSRGANALPRELMKRIRARQIE